MKYYLKLHFLLLLLACIQTSYALPILKDTVIDSDLVLDQKDLDMNRGNIIIQNNARVTIKNCRIKGTISPANPVLISVKKGYLKMLNNSIAVRTTKILPHPNAQSLHYFIRLEDGYVAIHNNNFVMANKETAGFFITSATIPVQHLTFTGNYFNNFHGVLYLLNVASSSVTNNTFENNTYGNIVINGTDNLINDNKIMRSGYNTDGANSIDVLNSDIITISNNLVMTSYLNGIFVYNSSNVNVDNNRISGSKFFGIKIQETTLNENLSKYPLNFPLKNFKHTDAPIKITDNNVSQNHYGLTALNVNTQLIINNNIFSQKFNNSQTRRYWTDNTNLLINSPNILWQSNFYREAFSQINGDPNTSALNFVPFPQTGGVIL